MQNKYTHICCAQIMHQNYPPKFGLSENTNELLNRFIYKRVMQIHSRSGLSMDVGDAC